MQLEEALNILTFSCSAADQEVAQLINRTQLLKDVASLKGRKSLEETLKLRLNFKVMKSDCIFNLCRKKDEFLRGNVVLLDDHR